MAGCLQLTEAPPSVPSFHINLTIEDAHDGDRKEEGADGRDNRDGGVGKEGDVTVVLRHAPLAGDVLPREDPRGPEEHGYDPRPCDHHSSLLRGAMGPVGQRSGHREVPVEADDEEVCHRGIAHRVVQGQPDVAYVPSEGPAVVQQEVHGVEGDGDYPDDQVGHGQTQQEVVADRLQLGFDLERHQHHQVAADRNNRYDGRHERYDARDGQRVRRSVATNRRRHGGVIRHDGRRMVVGCEEVDGC